MDDFEDMADIASFQPGYWKGNYYTPEFVKSLHDNFQKYSAGDSPYYVPFLNLNHKDEFRYGSIVNATMDGDILKLSARKIPKPIADMVRNEHIAERSIEFYEPKMVDGKQEGFFGPDGKLVNGPVIRCLSLLGNQSPAVKGLGPLPTPTPESGSTSKFHERPSQRKTVSRFSDNAEDSQMNQELLDQLKTLKFDVTLIPADATDELLKAIIAALQVGSANPIPESSPEPVSTPMADPSGMPAPSAAPLAAAGLNPSQITTVTKFMDAVAATAANNAVKLYVGQNQAVLNKIKADALVASNRFAADEKKRKESAIETFLDSVKSQVIPAMRPSVKALLLNLDNGTVKTFTDGKTTGTYLDEMMATIKSTYPAHKNAPNGGNPKTPQAPIATLDNPSGVRTEVVSKLLSATPNGRAILKRQADAAKK